MNLGHKTGGVVGYSRDATPTIRNIHSCLNINVTEAETSAQRPGGILGSAVNGTTVIENCTYSGTLNVGGHTGNIGGIVGYVNNNTAAIVNITNCLFDGKILNGTTAEGQCGGIVGYNNAGVVTIKNCLSIGTITSEETNIGQFFGRLNANNSKFENCYYVGDFVNGTKGAGTAGGSAPVKVTAEQLASGEICYALNGNKSEDVNWFQTLNDEAYPTPYGTDIVYLAGQTHCDGTAYEGVTGFTNTPSAQDDHTFADGFCTYCGALDANYLTANADGFFEIGTANQLKWFAIYVNQVDPAVNAILTADINLNGVEWTPIGKGVYYAGTFDGKNFAVSNLTYTGSGDCNGLFGGVKDATIKNFSVDGTIVCAGSWSGAIGRAENATISNVHSALTIQTPETGTFHHAGGVVGGSYNPTIIDRCSYSGTMTVNADSHDCFGGIVGYTTDYCKVSNCINYGTVNFAKNNCYAGGIVGYINSAACYGAHNCLNVGDVVYTGEGDPTYSGAIVGRLRGNTPASWGNSYWLEGSAVNATGENQIPTNFMVTELQIASGEVAAKLAPYIRQNIGTDEAPVLDPTHNVVAEITAAGYGTLYVPDTDVTVPTGVIAFTGLTDGEWLRLTAIEGAIAADEPVVLKGNAGIYSFVPTTGATKATENDLKGTAEDTAAEGKYVLALPDADSEIGFYLAESGFIRSGKAYLEVASGVKAFFFGEDDATGISNVNTNANEKIYNLAGQRLSKIQKGINIVGNKKVLY